MVLIIDSSASIGSTELTQMKTAFKGFVDAFLPNTPTQIAVVEFDTTAHTVHAYNSNGTLIKSYIDAASSGGYTNWDDALVKAYALFDNRVDKPDLYVFASDGNPNTIFANGTSVSETVAVAKAVTDANQIKLSGIRIITLGIGSDVNSANLIAISSADAYYSSGFDTLAQTLANLSNQLCGGTITVKKLVDGGLVGADDWTFSTTVTGGTSNPTSSVTDTSGFINPAFAINASGSSADVTVTETPKAGYSFVSASCTKNNQTIGSCSAGACAFTMGKTDAIYCEFRNTQHECDRDEQCGDTYYNCVGNTNVANDPYCNQTTHTCMVTQTTENCSNYNQNSCDGTVWVHQTGTCIEDQPQCAVASSTGNCVDALWCNGQETCSQGNCFPGTPVNCTENNIPGIATCDWIPDNYPPTFDFRNAFTSQCVESVTVANLGYCTNGDTTITHTCNYTNCGAECDETHACGDKCVGNFFYTLGECLDDCVCDYLQVDCNDGIACTVDSCGPNDCTHTPDNSLCNDGDPCTTDVCDVGTGCVNTFSDTIGPVTSNLAVIPSYNNGIFNSTALATDTCSNIKQSEYFLGHSSIGSCGIPGTGQGYMDATDGGFDEKIEDLKKGNINYIVDGQNFICVKSQDVANNWGNCECAYFETDIFPPDCAYDLYLDTHLNPQEYLICGNNAWLNATVCDDQTPIQGGEYFIDAAIPPIPAPWSGIWMNPLLNFTRPSDGHPCSIIGAFVNASNLSDGTHYINLRGKDSVENWGKITHCMNVSFIRDTLPPVTEKTLLPAGQALHECTQDDIVQSNLPLGVQLTNGCGFMKAGTTVTLHAVDPDPQHTGEHADKTKIHWIVWYKVYPEDAWVKDQEGVGTENQDVVITLNKDSYHLIEYWSVDACGWEEAHHYELDIVDTKPPVITKVIGDPKIACGPSDNCDYWVRDHVTTIDLYCSDQQPHPVDHVQLWYRILLDGQVITDWTDPVAQEAHKQIIFNEDSVHTLEYYCVDALGNSEGTRENPHRQVYKVDSTPPTTVKTYGQPLVEAVTGGYPKWINSSTPITLTATDGGDICHVGVNKTYWRNTLIENNEACMIPDICHQYSGEGPFIEYTGPFYKPEDSCHLIEYYSVDSLGNAEGVKKQCVFVDNKPPISTKAVGDPKKQVDCATVDPGTYTDSCYYINQSTPITLRCSDQDPHPVDQVKIFYKTDWKNQSGDSWSLGAWQEDSNLITFVYGSDSYHRLTWYCIDALGNKEADHTELDIVDTQPPVSVKAIGNPKHACTPEEQAEYYPQMPAPTNGCYYINQSTPITLTCQDGLPHPVDNVKIKYKDWLFDHAEPDWTVVDGNTVTIYKNEDSAHILKWTCVDELGNTETTHTEYDIVDTQPPVTTKTIEGPVYYNDDKTYIDGVSRIKLECSDPGLHPVDHQVIKYRYRVNEGQGYGAWTEWITYCEPFGFPEESMHELEFYCVDALGNEEIHQTEVDYVDKTPPVTTKTYGQPFVTNGVSEWINSSTPITLTATDGTSIHASGVDYTKFRVSMVGDSYCQSQEACLSATGSGEWSTYATGQPFTINEQSCHLIEYYSVDHVNKTETVKKQCTFVENTPPHSTKTVGAPNHECTEQEQSANYPGMAATDGCLFINQSTPITITCSDQEPHPVDQVKIFYKDWIFGETEPAYTEVNGNTVTIYKTEDSAHILKWYCIDALGNKESTRTEFDIVDSKPPVSYKELIGTKVKCSELPCANQSDCDYYITQDTKIKLTCSADQTPHPVDHTVIKYRYSVDDGTFTAWNTYTVPFSYSEDSKHTLEWYCVDELGNKEETHNEIDRVDTKPPVTTKTIGTPSWDNGYFVTSQTPITLTTVDQAAPCASDSGKLYYKLSWDKNCDGDFNDHNEQGEWQHVYVNASTCKLETTIKLQGECLHQIEWYAEDALGNKEEKHTQLHKVDNTPPHVLILKPVDGWYSDGEDIPVAAMVDDKNSPESPCEQGRNNCNGLGTECASGIADGAPCDGYFLDVLPQLKMVQLESHMTYNAEAKECQGWVTLNNTASQLPDGIVIFVVGARDNLGNMANSLDEIQNAVMGTCGCDVYDLCEPSCIDDAIKDIVLNWNLPKIGLDNYPLNIEIVSPQGGSVIGEGASSLYVEADVDDGGDGQITSGITTGTPCYIKLAGVSVGTVPFQSDTDKCSGTVPIPSNIPQGAQPLVVELADNAGNMGMGMISVIVDNNDPTPVSIQVLNTEKDGIYDTDGSYRVQWSGGEDASFVKYVLYKNGVAYQTFTDQSTKHWDESGIADGTYKYRVESFDLGGGVAASTEATVIEDKTKPVIDIKSSIPLGFMYALTYMASDPSPGSGVDYVQVMAPSSGICSLGICFVYGSNDATIRVYDKAGNYGEDSISGIKSDFTPPTITFSSPSGLIGNSNPTLRVETSENATCYYGAEDNVSSMQLMATDAAGLVHTAGLGTLVDGLYVYHAQCKDMWGNWMEHSKTIVFSINTDSQWCYRTDMSYGWNSFFLPNKILEDIHFGCSDDGNYQVTDVLASLYNGSSAEFRLVWYYDGTKWLFYDPQNPESSTLTEFNDEISNPYYAYMNAADKLELACQQCAI